MAMREVVLFSEHVYESGRRAGFHWLADAYLDAGWRITFVTAGVSLISALRGDFRTGMVPPARRNKFRDIEQNVSGYFWSPPFHPVNLRNEMANRLSGPFFKTYGSMPLGRLSEAVSRADTIIVESSHALALVPRLRRLAPKAFMVYRVSDDVRVVGHHPIIATFERRALPHFDFISVPSEHMIKLFPEGAPVAIQYHGLQTAWFEQPVPSPYSAPVNVLSVGSTLFDRRAVETFAAACPDVTFHLFGRFAPFPHPNVLLYGEMPFVELIPYLRHADVGFAPYIFRPGCEYLAHTSNKVMQYTFCRKPVLLPHFVPNNASHIVPYRPHDATDAARAMARAREIPAKSIDASWIRPWSCVQQAIEARRPPPRQA
jgi:2-beta-glucuronyltransferase